MCMGDSSSRVPPALRTGSGPWARKEIRKEVHIYSLLERVEIRLREDRHRPVVVVVGHVADGRER